MFTHGQNAQLREEIWVIAVSKPVAVTASHMSYSISNVSALSSEEYDLLQSNYYAIVYIA